MDFVSLHLFETEEVCVWVSGIGYDMAASLARLYCFHETFQGTWTAQLFLPRYWKRNRTLEIANIVDYFLIIGPRKNIEDFYVAMESRFKIGKFNFD